MGREKGHEEVWVLNDPSRFDTCADHIEYIPYGHEHLDLRSKEERKKEHKRALRAAVKAINKELKRQRSKK